MLAKLKAVQQKEMGTNVGSIKCMENMVIYSIHLAIHFIIFVQPREAVRENVIHMALPYEVGASNRTPKSFLELLELFKIMLKKKRK